VGGVRFKSISINAPFGFPTKLVSKAIYNYVYKNLRWPILSLFDEPTEDHFSGENSKLLQYIRRIELAPKEAMLFDRHILYAISMADHSIRVKQAALRRAMGKNTLHIAIDPDEDVGYSMSRINLCVDATSYGNIYRRFFQNVLLASLDKECCICTVKYILPSIDSDYRDTLTEDVVALLHEKVPVEKFQL
jgi:hypothetical protein